MAYNNKKKFDKTKPYVRDDQSRIDEIKHNATVAMDALIDGIQNGYTDRFKKYLETAAKLHTYSWSNMMWLYAQNPNLSEVGSYDAWQKLGRQVRKGEGGMYVTVPYFPKKGEATNAEGKDDKGFPVFFAVKKGVFDISQTDPIEGKEQGVFQWWHDLGDADNGLYGMSEKVAAELGLTYREENTGSANGYAAGKEIVVKDTLPTVNKVKTFIHEAAHHMHGHVSEKSPDKKLRELEAEATAYIVSSHFGLDTSELTFDYLINWGATPDTLRAAFSRIIKAAHKIIAAYDAASGNAE